MDTLKVSCLSNKMPPAAPMSRPSSAGPPRKFSVPKTDPKDYARLAPQERKKASEKNASIILADSAEARQDEIKSIVPGTYTGKNKITTMEDGQIKTTEGYGRRRRRHTKKVRKHKRKHTRRRR
jgi:hypothetical protein